MILCSTLHDPSASLLEYLSEAVKNVDKSYTKWVVRTTDATDVRIIEKLKGLGVNVVGKEAEAVITDNKIEDDHLIALKAGLETAQELHDPTLQYTDGDRVIMATNEFPDDFANTAEGARTFFQQNASTKHPTYLNLRRSGEDYLTHHAPLVQTELVFNRWYSEVLNKTIDIGSTAHVMTIDVAEEILRQSPELDRVSFPHPLWLIIAVRMGAEINSAETHNVGSFETPLQAKDEVIKEMKSTPDSQITPKQLGDYSNLQHAYMATLGVKGPNSVTSPDEWGRRLSTEEQYQSLLLKYLDSLVSDPDRINELRIGITNSLESIRKQREIVVDTLSTPEDKVRARLDAAIRSYSVEVGRPDPRSRKEFA